MRQELDDRLTKTFPLLYADRRKSIRETCMCWGFDVGDGWFDLIWALSEKLEVLIGKHIKEHGPSCHPRAAQVKEKFGGLRFYMTTSSDEMETLIEKAESVAWRTCEDCGKSGKCNNTGWLVTLCNECRKERQNEHSELINSP